jgi:hypothetical protein
MKCAAYYDRRERREEKKKRYWRQIKALNMTSLIPLEKFQ